SGLEEILQNAKKASGESNDQNEDTQEITYNAKLFYFSKLYPQFNRHQYLVWKQNQEQNATSNDNDEKSKNKAVQNDSINDDNDDDCNNNKTSDADDEDSSPLTFAEIAQKIAKGEPIPGIKEIPDKISDIKPSVSTLKAAPPKPWEMGASLTIPAAKDAPEEETRPE
ncbi:hypothetical protein H4219_006309, partial [Mycoemilia scoparia]